MPNSNTVRHEQRERECVCVCWPEVDAMQTSLNMRGGEDMREAAGVQ